MSMPAQQQRTVTPHETYEHHAAELIAQHGRVIGKRMLRDEEPKVTVFLQATEDDLKEQRDDGSFPPAVLMLDGTRYEVRVGEENVLPQSVWEAYRTSRKLARVRVPGVFTRAVGDEMPEPR
jgi:hypothetical protein